MINYWFFALTIAVPFSLTTALSQQHNICLLRLNWREVIKTWTYKPSSSLFLQLRFFEFFFEFPQKQGPLRDNLESQITFGLSIQVTCQAENLSIKNCETDACVAISRCYRYSLQLLMSSLLQKDRGCRYLQKWVKPLSK